MQLPLSVTVGVTGRRELPTTQYERISAQVQSALQAIFIHCEELAGKDDDVSASKKIDISICSCLSEGADRLVAHHGLALGYHLDAVLPFHKDSLIHARDLDALEQSQSRTELHTLLAQARHTTDFGKDRETIGLEDSHEGYKLRHEAYLDAGLAMLERSDIVLALWDGQKKLHVGGTYDIIKRAIEQKILVLWINTEENTPLCEYTYFDDDFVCIELRHMTERMQILVEAMSK